MRYVIFSSIIVAFIAVLIAGCSSTAPTPVSTQYDSLAKCMTAHNVTMYGAYWCPHCQNTKKTFSSSFQYVNYVECGVQGDPSAQAPECTALNITAYPTWQINNARIEGELSIFDLANDSGCIDALTNTTA